MANAKYTTFTQDLMTETFHMTSDGIKAALIDAADYSFSAAHDEYANDVAGAAKVAVSSALGSPTVTAGVFDTADFTWTAVTGDQSENIILFDDDTTNDRLISFYDTGMTGMPVTPNGGDINVQVNGSGWFTI